MLKRLYYFAIVISISFTGCYTSFDAVDVEEREIAQAAEDYSGEEENIVYYDEQDSTEYYEDTGGDVDIYYYDEYYPVYTPVILRTSYYYPFYWDWYYWDWYWYSPYYYTYWNPWYYPPYYSYYNCWWGGYPWYYDNYPGYYYSPSPYKYRTNYAGLRDYNNGGRGNDRAVDNWRTRDPGARDLDLSALNPARRDQGAGVPSVSRGDREVDKIPNSRNPINVDKNIDKGNRNGEVGRTKNPGRAGKEVTPPAKGDRGNETIRAPKYTPGTPSKPSPIKPKAGESTRIKSPRKNTGSAKPPIAVTRKPAVSKKTKSVYTPSNRGEYRGNTKSKKTNTYKPRTQRRKTTPPKKTYTPPKKSYTPRHSTPTKRSYSPPKKSYSKPKSKSSRSYTPRSKSSGSRSYSGGSSRSSGSRSYSGSSSRSSGSRSYSGSGSHSSGSRSSGRSSGGRSSGGRRR